MIGAGPVTAAVVGPVGWNLAELATRKLAAELSTDHRQRDHRRLTIKVVHSTAPFNTARRVDRQG
jgi:hypothetical protein